MAGEWTPTPASEVEPGATVRMPDGRELEVSRIERDMMGMPGLLAFIEDTPRQWFKAPVSDTTEVEVRAAP
jgi:hypothetical protein